MELPSPHLSGGNPPQEEDYTHGYTTAFTQYLSRRTAATNAAFFLPYLRSGMRVLDCGCGPGTITIGLAQAVAPGQVVGIDIEPGQIEAAQAQAAEQQVHNVSFQVASIYQLPFPDNSFDAAFGHSILEHLGHPLEALREVHRVLKPGGLVGLREVDQGGNLLEPTSPILEKSLELQEKVWQLNGGDPHLGRTLRALLTATGFINTRASASYDSYGTPEEIRLWAERMVDHFSQSPLSDRLVALGWTDRAMLSQMCEAWRYWSDHPSAFYARARVEGIGKRR
jgi:ubiquinone/menaquinone biosynthesis C-methylase UbiE